MLPTCQGPAREVTPLSLWNLLVAAGLFATGTSMQLRVCPAHVLFHGVLGP